VRIIAGEFRGRHIEAPPHRKTRPMLDRVREALFSRLMHDVVDARVLDLFAGSGSLGLESLSRGAASARLVEADRGTARLLERNVRELGVEERAEVLCADALARSSWGESADLIFCDSPYPMLSESREPLFRALEALVTGVLEPTGVLVFHAPYRVVRSTEFVGASEVDSRRYGTNELWFLRP